MPQHARDQERQAVEQAIRSVLLQDAAGALAALPEVLGPLAQQEPGAHRQPLDDLAERATRELSWVTSASEAGQAAVLRTAARLDVDAGVLWECGEAGAELTRARPTLLRELADEPDAALRAATTRVLDTFLLGVLLHIEQADGPRTLVGHLHVLAADEPLAAARLAWRCEAHPSGRLQVDIRPPTGVADAWLVDRFIAAQPGEPVAAEIAGAAIGRALLAAALWQLWRSVPPDPDDWDEGDDGGSGRDPPPEPPPGDPPARVQPSHTTTPGQRGASRTRRTKSVPSH